MSASPTTWSCVIPSSVDNATDKAKIRSLLSQLIDRPPFSHMHLHEPLFRNVYTSSADLPAVLTSTAVTERSAIVFVIMPSERDDRVLVRRENGVYEGYHAWMDEYDVPCQGMFMFTIRQTIDRYGDRHGCVHSMATEARIKIERMGVAEAAVLKSTCYRRYAQQGTNNGGRFMSRYGGRDRASIAADVDSMSDAMRDMNWRVRK